MRSLGSAPLASGSVEASRPGTNLLKAIPYSVNGTRRVNEKAVSYTHLRAHETPEHLVCRLLLEKKKKNSQQTSILQTIKKTIEAIL